MGDFLWVTILLGAIAFTGCALAVKAGTAAKRNDGASPRVVQAFWAPMTVYAGAFTLLRASIAFDLGWHVALYYVATIAGASTLVSLLYMFFGILIGPQAAKWAAKAATAFATAIVFFIFYYGLDGPFVDEWSVQLIPSNPGVRALIAFTYMAVPVALAALVFWAVRHVGPATKRRTTMFATAVLLIYIPSAIPYVWTAGGPAGTILAALIATGALTGWQSYRNPVGNA
ncbi:MAG: hypothetical protein ACPHK8_02585 [Thermoplasmatota archaeon]